MWEEIAEGMAQIKRNGGRTIVQDPSTAVISSMPLAAIKKGAADKIAPLDKIASSVMHLLSREHGKER
ncbi:MAG: chemotaxis protein CheB [Firmicutes bacterium]|nr:chemotaxis protein CheB [Bacillota bacterium]